MSLLNSLISAANKPFVQPMVWPADLEADHAIRDVIQHLRLWPTAEAQKLQAEFARIGKLTEPDNDWIGQTYWWVIALSAATPSGKGLFDDSWPEIATTFPSDELSPPAPERTSQPDYKVMGDYLKTQLDGPMGLRVMAPIWGAAMELNGYATKKEATDAKNSEKTATSK